MIVDGSHVLNINKVARFDISLVQVMRSALEGLNGKFKQIKLTVFYFKNYLKSNSQLVLQRLDSI